MTAVPVRIGQHAVFSKTVSESDVYLFAGITGDLAPNHVNEAYMRGTAYGRRIAHGALIVGYMSRCSTMIIEQSPPAGDGAVPVSLGYDRVRFLGPVFIGDTVTLTYEIAAIDEAKRRSTAKIEVKTERGDLVAVAEHILKWVAPSAP